MRMHLDELLSAYLDGEVSAEERSCVVRHLETCPACRDDLAALHAARSMVRSLPTLEPPAGLIPTDGQVAVVVPLRRRRRTWAAAVAAAVTALTIGIATAMAPAPPTPISISDLSNQHGARSSLDPGVTPVKLPPVDIEVEGIE